MCVIRRWAWWWALAAWAGAGGARELDPAACAARFDVQRDKIIRTEESREMGARYLSELDVGARTECLRLCCETDSCDVFVFEEKSPGSCYLFNCGPPEDFRCKFTAHGNFSSGVLALGRRLAELQDRERLAHHERELASLRSPTSTTASTTPAARSSPRPPPDPPRPPPPLPRRCSRYQFECRRGGECIAVYNACDGVPQCADASDEAPELGCPPSAPPATRAPPAPPAPPAPQMQLQESAEEGGAAAEGAPWPHRLAQAQPQRRYNSYTDTGSGGAGGGAAGGGAGGSHIFSHKGGLLQESAPWPQRAWQPPLAGAESMEGERGWGAYGRLDWPDAEPRRAWPVPPRPDPDIPLYMPSKTMPEMPMVYSSQQQTLRDSPKKGFELLSKGPPAEPPTAPPAPPAAPPAPPPRDRDDDGKPSLVENTTKKKVLKDTQAAESKVASAAGAAGAGGAALAAARAAGEHWALDEHDGLSERPPAAVLLLVLGSLMTASLGALLACRARAARRRRRAHPRLALDADYLVNGMYL